MPNRLPGLPVNTTDDGHLRLSDLEIVCDALTVNQAVSRKVLLCTSAIRGAAVTGGAVSEEVVSSGLRSRCLRHLSF